MEEITQEQFEAYVDVQESGVTNMFDVKTVGELSGLEKEEIMSEKDLLQLTEDDLIELGFKLGSRNRILSWKLENICKNI